MECIGNQIFHPSRPFVSRAPEKSSSSSRAPLGVSVPRGRGFFFSRDCTPRGKKLGGFANRNDRRNAPSSAHYRRRVLWLVVVKKNCSIDQSPREFETICASKFRKLAPRIRALRRSVKFAISSPFDCTFENLHGKTMTEVERYSKF